MVSRQLPGNMPVVKKVYAINVNDAGKNPDFKRSSYTLLDDTKNAHLTLIHYTGDHSTATHFPHGNSKSKAKKLILEHVLRYYKQLVKFKMYHPMFTRKW